MQWHSVACQDHTLIRRLAGLTISEHEKTLCHDYTTPITRRYPEDEAAARTWIAPLLKQLKRGRATALLRKRCFNLAI